MLIKPKAGSAAKIKVVGVGGGGGNAISSMINEGGIEGVEFVAINTDSQALLHNKAEIKIQIGDQATKGLGSGGNPEVGRKAAEESMEKLKDELGTADMIFITCGEGGGTGTGASPIVAQVAKESGALTVAVVTKPFDFEGAPRRNQASTGIESLRENVDTLIVIPNQRVLQVIDKKTSIVDAFRKIDSVLYQGVKGIAELITLPGLINVDFADVRSIMSNAGNALMGMGIGTGDKRAITAIRQAISSPLLDASIDGAKGILLNVVGGTDLSMNEIEEAASMIQKAVDSDANIIWGAAVDENLTDQIKITVIATRFDDSKQNVFSFSKKSSFNNFTEEEEEGEKVVSTEDNNETESFTSDNSSKYEEPAETRKSPSGPKSFFSKKVTVSEEDEFDIPAFLRKK